MEMYTFYLFFILVVLTSCSAIPKPGEKEHKERVIEKKLSDFEHGEDDNHNNEYDHDAFLGKEDAKTFDQLSPEESKERLGYIVDKIDKDKDGFVTEQELKEWVQYVQKRYVTSDTERMWKEQKSDDKEGDADNTLKWESYKKRTYGYEDDANDENSPNFSYKDQINRDERRWKVADKDNDGLLSKEEFSDFLHPEEAEHMRDIVVQETIEDIDKDKDGYISLEEYIADVYDEEGDDDDDDDDDDDRHDKEKGPHEYPEWVKSEKEQFASVRDKNKDGKLDKDEVKEWIIPQDFDHSQAEATHLMFESDTDKDGKLTKSEILDKYDLFVGSQATDFGEALTKHDEF